QHRPGCRPWGARLVRGAHGGPVGAPYRWGGGSARAVGGGWAARGGFVVVFPEPGWGPPPGAGGPTGLQHGGGVWAGRGAGWRGAAWAVVGPRHESLRTLFPAPEGIPQQLVVPVERADFGWQIIDATGWPESRLGEAIGTAVRHTFDLATEIPLRARLFTLA